MYAGPPRGSGAAGNVESPAQYKDAPSGADKSAGYCKVMSNVQLTARCVSGRTQRTALTTC